MSAPPGMRAVDLLLYDRTFKLLATVQVKTRSTKEREGWMISRRQIAHHRENHFYILVDLDFKPSGIPTSYVVPSIVIADLATRAIKRDRNFAEALGEATLGAATKDSRLLNFFMLKPCLEEPHPLLGSDWPRGFENAFEVLTLPMFRFAAGRMSVMDRRGSHV